jgi:hypothetical protein
MKLGISFLNNFLSYPTGAIQETIMLTHLRWTVSYDPEGPFMPFATEPSISHFHSPDISSWFV